MPGILSLSFSGAFKSSVMPFSCTVTASVDDALIQRVHNLCVGRKPDYKYLYTWYIRSASLTWSAH